MVADLGEETVAIWLSDWQRGHAHIVAADVKPRVGGKLTDQSQNEINIIIVKKLNDALVSYPKTVQTK